MWRVSGLAGVEEAGRDRESVGTLAGLGGQDAVATEKRTGQASRLAYWKSAACPFLSGLQTAAASWRRLRRGAAVFAWQGMDESLVREAGPAGRGASTTDVAYLITTS